MATTTATTTTTTTPPASISLSSEKPFVPSGDVNAQIEFYQPPADGAAPVVEVHVPEPNQSRRNFTSEPQPVAVRDARGLESRFTLDHDAFELLTADAVGPLPSVKNLDRAEFSSDDSVRANYYPEVEELLLRHIPGAHKVVIFDHTIRRQDTALVVDSAAAQQEQASTQPVRFAHVDQTPRAVERRVRRHRAEHGHDDADELLRGRYRLVNVWRPLALDAPVEQMPLAFASSASVADEDLVMVRRVYPTFEGETAALLPAEGQKWWYWSGMTGRERILLECFDSEALRGEEAKVKGGRTPHTAFEHPDTRAGAAPRESIEVRTLVFGP